MERELLAELNDLLEQAQRVLAEYARPPDSGITATDAVERLLGILDGPQQRRVQGQVRRLIEERPAISF